MTFFKEAIQPGSRADDTGADLSAMMDFTFNPVKALDYAITAGAESDLKGRPADARFWTAVALGLRPLAVAIAPVINVDGMAVLEDLEAKYRMPAYRPGLVVYRGPDEAEPT